MNCQAMPSNDLSHFFRILLLAFTFKSDIPESENGGRFARCAYDPTKTSHWTSELILLIVGETKQFRPKLR